MLDATLTGDTLEMYFSSAKLGTSDLWKSIRANASQPWNRATRVDELATPDHEFEPDLAADGLTIYFVRDPFSLDPDFRIFVSQRSSRSAPWDPPQLLALGTPATDRGPSIDRGGVNLVFASTRAGGAFDLYLTTRSLPSSAWGEPVGLAEINTNDEDWDPGLFHDGLSLAFGSRRAGRTTDLFECSRLSASDAFRQPAPMAELNSPSSEGDPWLSNDGKYIVFTSDRDGTSRFYEAWR